MSTDLHEHLETSFGDGPAHRPVDDRLVAGRRALRRRRTATTGGAAVVAAALALTPAAVSHLHGASDPAQLTGPTAPTADLPIDLPVAPAGRVGPTSLPLVVLHTALYRRDGSVQVLRLIQPAVPGHPLTAAAVVTVDGARRWVFVAGREQAGRLSDPVPGTTLVAWARRQLPASHDTTIAPGHTYAENPIPRADSPVRWSGDTLAAKPGTTITQRIADPAYSTHAVPASCTTRAVAATADGTDYFVLGYTCPDGTWDLFTETAGARADTLTAWLDAVKAAQDGGEGAR